MKKDKKYLEELEKKLEFISARDKRAIVLKYQKIIDERKENKEKIVSILKSIGPVSEVAEKEIAEYRKTRNAEYMINKFFSKFKKDKASTPNKDKKGEKKAEDKKKETNKDKTSFIQKIKDKRAKRKEERLKKKEEKEKQKQELEKVTTEEKQELEDKEKEVIKETKAEEKSSENKVSFFDKLKEKRTKRKEERLKKKEEKKKEKEKKEKKSFFDRFKKKKTLKEKIEDKIEEITEEVPDEIADVTEIVSEKKIFETKEQRIKRIILSTIRVIFTIILLFAWLWICVIFIAGCFAFLDGVKLYGMVIALGGLTMLVLSIIIIINGSLFRRKVRRLWPFLAIILFTAVTAAGIALFMKEIQKIKVTSDVTEKYNMTKKSTSYNLPNDPEKKLFITFNSNYNTDYIIEYDKTISDKVNVEVKYFECYYDYFAKKDSNNLYISLGLDNRDRLSVYIDDLKEGKIYDNKELERYVVKITYNEKDKDRIVIK